MGAFNHTGSSIRKQDILAMNTYLKFSVTVTLFAAWCVLVAYDLAPSADLVSFIKYALAGLAAHQATITPYPYPGDSK